MKLVFFGTPDFAVPSLQSLHASPHEVLSVVTNPDKKSGRGLKLNSSPVKKTGESLGLDIIQPDDLKDENFISYLKQINPDIYVVVAFKILPEMLLTLPVAGAINLHASLLPKYRGAAPINHAILNGETQTGLTTFQLKKKVDTGNILLQKTIPISRTATVGDLYYQLSQMGGDILIDTLNGIEKKSITPQPQNEIYTSSAPKISAKDALIDWKNSAIAIHNRIRAFTPKPGAFTFYNNKRIKLFNSEIENTESSLIPGEIRYENTNLIIGTGEGSVLIKEIQMEGKKRLPVSQFIAGNQHIIGEYFG
ncbi:MAG: methionyl-tRNA formyltransferase [Candidatus Marinimicrobia bacterium]|jgi:methionyl-tRNA formyltransferase|nr:methionyl-tRNA formyltransferase [Candidatus Neomarinimicrobiota bacterium]